MNIILFLSEAAVPLIIVAVVTHALLTRSAPYDAFIEGASDGLKTIAGILPTLIGLMAAVGVLSGTGALAAITRFLAPLADAVGYPGEVIPLVLTRLVSSSASTGVLLDIFKTYGPDSFTGRYVSILFSSTETVFYTMAVYFLSVKITKTRHTLPAALAANLSGVIISLYMTQWVFGR